MYQVLEVEIFKAGGEAMDGITYEERANLMEEGQEIVMAFLYFSARLSRKVNFHYYAANELKDYLNYSNPTKPRFAGCGTGLAAKPCLVGVGEGDSMPKTLAGSGVASFFYQFAALIRGRINLKKTVLTALELGGLKLGQSDPNLGPGLTALTLCNAFDQQGKDADQRKGSANLDPQWRATA